MTYKVHVCYYNMIGANIPHCKYNMCIYHGKHSTKYYEYATANREHALPPVRERICNGSNNLCGCGPEGFFVHANNAKHVESMVPFMDRQCFCKDICSLLVGDDILHIKVAIIQEFFN